MSLAIVGGSGGCRTVFIHGVLSAFEAVAYASTRLRHPYIDASYLCAIPAVELADQGRCI